MAVRWTWLVVVAGGLAAAHLGSRWRRDPHGERIAGLDPQADHEEITQILGEYVFPWDTETALSFALLRTFAVPSVSRILDGTGEFTRRPRKRYDDTELLLGEIGEHGYGSSRGRAAIRRVNQMHAAYPISQEDLRYVLSTFVFEPERWIERHGWRQLTGAELEAGWRYWRELGRRMGVRDLPESRAEFGRWNRAYEAAHFRFDPANRRVADATLDMYLRTRLRVPGPLLPAARRVALSLVEPELVRALGHRPPPRWLGTATSGALRARAGVQRWLLPARRRPYLVTKVPRPSYPHGYVLEQLGTFPRPGRPPPPTRLVRGPG